jgi:hypothetical protein
LATSLFDTIGLHLPRQEQRRRGLHPARNLHVSRELEIGRAAEHLVCADLLLHGWTAYATDQGIPYDIIVDVGSSLVRVQVKATLCPRNPQPRGRSSPAYFFCIRRAGKCGRRRYGEGEFDVYALVALDRRAVAYFVTSDLPSQSVVLRAPGVRYGNGAKQFREFEGATFDRALKRLQELTGDGTVLDGDGRAFDELAAVRVQATDAGS